MIVIAVALAGGLGAAFRFGFDGFIRSRARTSLPLGTMTINITGSLLLGALAGLVLFHGAPTELETIAGTGFLGGYTTFSTASFETVRLVQARRLRSAIVNGLGTLVLACGAAAGGLALVWAL